MKRGKNGARAEQRMRSVRLEVEVLEPRNLPSTIAGLLDNVIPNVGSFSPGPESVASLPSPSKASGSAASGASSSQAIAIDAGGGATGSFLSDTDVSGGSTSSTTDTINTSNVANPAPQAIYQTERYGNFTYTVPNLTPGSSYTVRLDFAEIYWNAAGQRLFNVTINGQQVLTNFDIFAAAGGKDIAIAESFTATANASGQIVLTFTTVKDNAKVSGIEITPTTPAAPSAPAGLTAAAGSGQVSLSWNAVAGATSYSLYRGTSSGGETLVQTGLTGTSYTDTGLSNGTTYYYQVTAVNSVGQSSRSTESTSAPVAAATASIAIDAGGGATGSFLSDTDVSGGSTYSNNDTINTSGVSNPAPQSVYQSEHNGNFTYTVPNLTPGSSYTVRLDFAEIYWNAAGQRLFNVTINGQQVLTNFDIFAAAGGKDIAIAESFTATANASGQIVLTFTTVKDNAKVSGIEITPTTPAAPSAPAGLTAAAGSGQVSLSWNAVAGATSYNLYRGTSSGGETLVQAGLTGTSYTDTGLSNGTTYYYQVTAVNSVGQSSRSTESTSAPVAAATASIAIDAGGGATGSFLSDTDVSGGSTSSTTDTINTSNVANPAPQAIYQTERYGNFTYTVPNLTPGSSYTVRLDFAEIYWNAAGQRLFNVTINGQQVLTNFDIFAAAGGKDIAIAESFTATANASGQIVLTFTTVKDNAKVSGIEITPTTPAAPSAPAGLTAAAGSGQVSLSWNAVAGATSYNLYRGTSSGGETLVQAGLTGTSYTDTGLSNGTAYYYQVTAVNSYGASAKSTEVSAAPGNDWFSTNMPDPGLQNLARTDFLRDGSITYTDMLGLLNQAVTEGTVTQNVLSSLQALASSNGAAYLHVTASVQGLINNVANGSATTYQGSPLAALAIGSSATQLQDLVNKWFLGEDLPTVDTQYWGVSGYELAGGNLYGSSGAPQYADIVQGEEGDCWLLASFAEIAAKQPGIIQGSFTDDGLVLENGVQVHVWTYCYYSGSTPQYLTLNNYFPDNGGVFCYADYQGTVSSSSNVLWAPLMEKAYAEIEGGAYANLNIGYAQNVLPMETGGSAGGYIFGSQSSYVSAVNSSSTLLTLACWSTAYGLVSDHDYAVISYNAANQTFQLYNPWGFDQPGPLTWAQLQQCFTQDGNTVVNSAPEINLPSNSSTNSRAPAVASNWSRQSFSALDLSVCNGGTQITPASGDSAPSHATSGARKPVAGSETLPADLAPPSNNNLRTSASPREGHGQALDAFFAQWDRWDM